MWVMGNKVRHFGMTEKPQLELILGGLDALQAQRANQLASLLEQPDGKAAWVQIKQLARQCRPAANSPLGVVSADSSAAAAASQNGPDTPE